MPNSVPIILAMFLWALASSRGWGRSFIMARTSHGPVLLTVSRGCQPLQSQGVWALINEQHYARQQLYEDGFGRAFRGAWRCS